MSQVYDYFCSLQYFIFCEVNLKENNSGKRHRYRLCGGLKEVASKEVAIFAGMAL